MCGAVTTSNLWVDRIITCDLEDGHAGMHEWGSAEGTIDWRGDTEDT